MFHDAQRIIRAANNTYTIYVMYYMTNEMARDPTLSIVRGYTGVGTLTLLLRVIIMSPWGSPELCKKIFKN